MNKNLRELRRIKQLVREYEQHENENYNFYARRTLHEYVNDDAMTPAEQGFMMGYLETDE